VLKVRLHSTEWSGTIPPLAGPDAPQGVVGSFGCQRSTQYITIEIIQDIKGRGEGKGKSVNGKTIS